MKIDPYMHPHFQVLNTLAQLLTLYTDRERHKAQRYKWTDCLDTQTDDIMTNKKLSYRRETALQLC